MIKIVFFSSSDIAAPLLCALAKDSRYKILMIVTQPDKPAGRSLVLKKNPIKILSEELTIEVFQPEKLDSFSIEKLTLLKADIFLTFAYGKILPEDFLSLPAIAPINIHASLLPKYRGASPIQAVILNSEKETGICIMKMVKEMDAGPIFSTKKINIDENWTAGYLHQEIAKLAAEIVPNELVCLDADSYLAEQDHKLATFTKKITKDDAYLDFNKTSSEIFSMFKAYSPWPGVWTSYNKMRLKIIDLSISDDILKPGELKCEASSIKIGTLNGSISVTSLQLESKNVVSAKEFISGQKLSNGIILPS